MPPLPGQEEPIKRITKIVDWLITRPDCAPFCEPVDWRGLELWDYPEVITEMMDLGTIKRRLERGYYQRTYQVAEDVRLVWRNCMTYNADGSDFWLLAKSYMRRFEDRYRKIRQEFDVGEDDVPEEDGGGGGDTSSKKSSGSATKTPKGSASTSSNLSDGKSASSPLSAPKPTLDARAQFGSNLFLLSGVELGYVISTCEEECPKALESVRGGGGTDCHIEINVDLIPTKVFDMLNTYVLGKVGGRESGSSNNSSTKSKSSSTGSRPSSPSSEKKGPGKSKKRQKKE
ncbi:bromodomain containing protein [Nitzschia inconspicua]|uniref:Bromodomain containing protein n=1 Tax=Nitzschia inconspicua TaxID=303405 RepID=A0A9K3KN18_9STRA|nr:bromodomain containing protein [Nitzschia inconspicua]